MSHNPAPVRPAQCVLAGTHPTNSNVVAYRDSSNRIVFQIAPPKFLPRLCSDFASRILIRFLLRNSPPEFSSRVIISLVLRLVLSFLSVS